MILNRYDTFTNANFPMLIWRCWMTRNGVLKAGEEISTAGSVAFLTRYSAELTQIRQQEPAADARGKQKLYPEQKARCNLRHASTDGNWKPPAEQVIKINTDGAFRKTGHAATGVIARNSSGCLLAATWSRLAHCRDAEEAEARACLEGVMLAQQWPDSPVCVETDCAQVIRKLLAKNMDRSLVSPIISDILEEGSKLQSVSFSKIRREQNKVAHELAQLALRSGNGRASSAVDVPDSIGAALYSDSP
jgi:ribonuclease HI